MNTLPKLMKSNNEFEYAGGHLLRRTMDEWKDEPILKNELKKQFEVSRNDTIDFSWCPPVQKSLINFPKGVAASDGIRITS